MGKDVKGWSLKLATAEKFIFKKSVKGDVTLDYSDKAVKIKIQAETVGCSPLAC